MDQKFASPDASAPENKPQESKQKENPQPSLTAIWEKWWKKMQGRGWADNLLRIGSALVCLALVILILWVMQSFYLKGTLVGNSQSSASTEAAPADNRVILPAYSGVSPYTGIARVNDLHTFIPNKSRFQIQEYTVLSGDNVFAISQKFGLNPQTILWGNFGTLQDNPERLQPGQVLKILPVDGVLYEWHQDDGLNKVSEVFGVTPEDIINWPGNNLNPDTIGDYAKPNIAVGTQLVVPGGTREFISWFAPTIRRNDPASANVLGVGRCKPINTGPIGQGVFVWPANSHFISGYEFAPSSNHWGIDIHGEIGDPIYAIEAGVVVYAGWNDWGYGNLVIIDHGDGWQSLYGHMSALNVSCGDYITQPGQVIGYVGSTGRSSGPHIHFEMSLNGNRANPHKWLPG
jgi:murein DD-endopeptidase MepM/ murein hydrolase activator NlpD